MLEELENYFQSKEEPNRSCLFALRDIILGIDENVSETRKYGMPCYCYGKKMFAYLWTDKKTDVPYILFVEGKSLDHSQLESGGRARMKILSVNPNKDIEIGLIRMLLNQALDLYRK
ncbi:MAG: DUF1801 domain-containing protein [Flavobacteriales bacterium]|nr:DUF1801 domain-containing protein [Flavobacteriales bacterium]